MKNRELIVGVFAAVAIAALYLGFNYLKGKDFFHHTATYFVKYDNVSELAASNPVLVNGYAVGRVSKIGLLPREGNRVLVELEIEGNVPIGKDAKATLSSALLGSKSILLDLGDTRYPAKPGDTLRGELAKGMIEMISETANPVAVDMQSTLKKFNGILDDLAVTLETINPVIHKFNETPTKLNGLLDQSGQNLNDMSLTIKEVSDKLKLSLAELDPTLKNLRVISDSLRQLEINRTLEQTRTTLVSMSEIMTKLKNGDNSASKLLTEDSLYNNVNRLVLSIDSLTNHVNNDPKDFFGPLAKSRKKIERERRREEEKKKSSK
ncbi:MAG: MCE family protein [Bacteroidetes bacterium]|nr:MCE family protein [Bacteroidota bacterium]